jgi:hypothetical protein
MSEEVITRKEIVKKLADLRRAWQENTGVSLVDVNISLGLLLYDLANSTFELNQAETRHILGGPLALDVNAAINAGNVWVLESEQVN